MCAVQYAKRNVQRSILSKVKEEDIEIDIDVKNIKKEDLNEVNDKGQDNGDTVDSSNGKSECKFGSDDEKMSYKSGDEINLKLNEPIAAKDIKIETSSKDNQAKQLTNCRKRQTVRSTYNLSGVIEKLIARVSEKPVNVTSTQTDLEFSFPLRHDRTSYFFHINMFLHESEFFENSKRSHLKTEIHQHKNDLGPRAVHLPILR